MRGPRADAWEGPAGGPAAALPGALCAICPARAGPFAQRQLRAITAHAPWHIDFPDRVGAILRYAVTATVSGINITTVGLILMIVGVAGLLISLLYMFAPGRRRAVLVEREPYEDPPARY